jgi:glycosyltransferase involved in cell wall biosynthesis
VKSLLILQGQLSDYRRPVFNALAERYRVTVLHAGSPGRQDGDRFAEVIVPATKRGRFRIQPRGAIERVRKAHDVTVAMFDLAWPAYWLPALQRDPARFILWGHRYSGRALADALRNALMRRVDGILLYGAEDLPRLLASGIDERKIFVAPNTIDVPNHEDTSDLPKDSVLYVGRLQERKRLDVALRAFARVRRELDRPLLFNIVGAGPPEAQLRQCAADLGLSDSVRFHGAILDDARLKGFFASAIAYLSPGPVGLAVLHSFAYGVPVLTLRKEYHGPEFHNIANGVNSIVAETEQEFESALLELVRDPRRAAELGRRAYERHSSERTLDHMVAGFVAAVDAES